MATIIREISIDAPPDDVWSALRDFDAVHERLVPGFVIDSEPAGAGTRVVTFFNGAVAREVLVGIDEPQRRLAYAVVESALGCTHHNAGAQVVERGDGGSRFVWTTDVLPDDVAPRITMLVEHGLGVIKQTLESLPARP